MDFKNKIINNFDVAALEYINKFKPILKFMDESTEAIQECIGKYSVVHWKNNHNSPYTYSLIIDGRHYLDLIISHTTIWPVTLNQTNDICYLQLLEETFIKEIQESNIIIAKILYNSK